MLFWRVIRGRPRLTFSVVFGLAAYVALPWTLAARTRGLLAWDLTCLLFLILAAILFSGERHMAHDAAAQEEGEWTVFSIVIAGTIASFAAIIGEFSTHNDVAPATRTLHVSLVAGTLLLSWLMTHTVFAMRYAHEYYSGPRGGEIDKGLEFPGDEPPDYWDFVYFSLVLGMTFQVSDVQITSRKLRRLATVQGFLGFMFNTVILALTVNIAASLLGS